MRQVETITWHRACVTRSQARFQTTGARRKKARARLDHLMQRKADTLGNPETGLQLGARVAILTSVATSQENACPKP